jgi:hypothetical protein
LYTPNVATHLPPAPCEVRNFLEISLILLESVTVQKEFDQKPILVANEHLFGAKNGDLVQVLTTPKDGNLYGKVISIVAKGAFREGTKGSKGISL